LNPIKTFDKAVKVERQHNDDHGIFCSLVKVLLMKVIALHPPESPE
jgi:hypothetical protein